MSDHLDPQTGDPVAIVYTGGRAFVTMADEQIVTWHAPIEVVAKWAGRSGLLSRPVDHEGAVAIWV